MKLNCSVLFLSFLFGSFFSLLDMFLFHVKNKIQVRCVRRTALNTAKSKTFFDDFYMRLSM